MAFWFKSKDSVTRVAVRRLLTLVLMGSYLVASCQSVPISSNTVATYPWWCQPCEIKHRTRHSRGINEPVKNQFKIAILNYENTISKYVKQLHAKLQVENMTKKQFRKNNWLPRKKFFRTLQKDDENVLPELYHQIQIYALTIEKLLKMEIRSQDASFNVEERNRVLTSVKNNIKLILCETELEIAERQLTKPNQVPLNLLDKKIPETMDHLTEGLLMDYSILKDYYNFLKKCYNRIFAKSKRGKKSPKQVKSDKQKLPKRTKNVLSRKVNDS